MKKINLGAIIKVKYILTFIIASVWFVNGLFCKLLNIVPRHQEIVSVILGDDFAFVLTKAIGFLELLMVVWILSQFKTKWCAISQIMVVGIMNIIEFLMVPELLLFGRLNLLFALLFMAIVYFNEFKIQKPETVLNIQNV